MEAQTAGSPGWTGRERLALVPVVILALLYLCFEASEVVRLPSLIDDLFELGLLGAAFLLVPVSLVALSLTRGRARGMCAVGVLLGAVAFGRLAYEVYSGLGV